jgi:hypothetical protein
MSDPFLPSSAPLKQRPPSRRVVLWDELSQLHAQLNLPPPAETYTLEELEEVVEQRRQETQQRSGT